MNHYATNSESDNIAYRNSKRKEHRRTERNKQRTVNTISSVNRKKLLNSLISMHALTRATKKSFFKVKLGYIIVRSKA